MRPAWIPVAPVALLLASCAAIHQPGHDAAEGARLVVERVFESFNNCKVETLVANYSDDNLVFFTPGTPKALHSRAELRRYFSDLDSEPCSSPGSAKHTNVSLQLRQLGTDAAIVHAHTVVKYEDQGRPISFPFYFTFVLLQRDGRWLVVSQNAQPVPKP